MFQSTHPHGVRRKVRRLSKSSLSFNPRTHTGCDLCDRRFRVLNQFQSTHPHGVRHRQRLSGQRGRAVSIHAPTRGATRVRRLSLSSSSFNPRTHTGCDLCFTTSGQRLRSFNPRTHTGCDCIKSNLIIIFNVSIHAPTRGATIAETRLAALNEFQSTHPHGVRQSNHPPWGDSTQVSIHAPTRGATRMSFLFVLLVMTVSIHAPTRGATLHCAPLKSPHLFQSTHPHGVRPFVP